MNAGTRVYMQCAAITNGCMAFLVFDAPEGIRNLDIGRLDPKVAPEDAYVVMMLEMNGWHLDCGRWVCPAHPCVRR